MEREETALVSDETKKANSFIDIWRCEGCLTPLPYNELEELGWRSIQDDQQGKILLCPDCLTRAKVEEGDMHEMRWVRMNVEAGRRQLLISRPTLKDHLKKEADLLERAMSLKRIRLDKLSDAWWAELQELCDQLYEHAMRRALLGDYEDMGTIPSINRIFVELAPYWIHLRDISTKLLVPVKGDDALANEHLSSLALALSRQLINLSYGHKLTMGDHLRLAVPKELRKKLGVEGQARFVVRIRKMMSEPEMGVMIHLKAPPSAGSSRQ
jgi:hypothetical protein